jgi:hypothetical protein
LEFDAGVRDGGVHGDADPGVQVAFADDPGPGGVGEVAHAVIRVRRRVGDLDDSGQDLLGLVAQVGGEQVGVHGRAAGAERGQEHAALEDELLTVLAVGQAGEEAFQDVEDKKFLGGPGLAAGQVL